MKILNRRCSNKVKRLLLSQKGFGLVETLVAVAILGLSAVSFVSSLSAGARSVNTLDEQVVAQQLLSSQIEYLKDQTYDATGGSYSLIEAPEGYSLALEVDSHIYPDSDLQKITVTVRHHGQAVSSLENYKADR